MPPNRFESEVGNFLEGSHGDRTHIKRAGHHTVTPLCGTLLDFPLMQAKSPGSIRRDMSDSMARSTGDVTRLYTWDNSSVVIRYRP